MNINPAPPPYPKLPTKLVLTSTKSYFTPSRTLTYLESLLSSSNAILPLPDTSELLLALIPDFLTIHPCAQILTSRYGPPQAWPLVLGAQDCFWEVEHGPYTGEVVPTALQSLGVSIVELGHTERRRLLGETDKTTAKKARAVCACGMVPLICVGEVSSPPGRDGPLSQSVGLAMRELTSQVDSVLAAIPHDAPVILAYEPVWAIGAAQPAGVDYVGPVVQAIRGLVEAAERKGRSGQTKIVYGGSAGPGLWSGKSNGGNGLGQWVDGMFLGRFAHDISGVKAVVDELVESLKS